MHRMTRPIYIWGSSGRRFKSCQPDTVSPTLSARHTVSPAHCQPDTVQPDAVSPTIAGVTVCRAHVCQPDKGH